MALLDRIRRITSSGDYIAEIDGLRFVAIASVVAFHLFGYVAFYEKATAGTLLTTMLHNGDRGVRLFFVISGFILAVPFASHFLLGAKKVSLRAYFLRRLTRLEPPYLLNLLICFVVSLLIYRATFWQALPHLLASGSYTHNAIFGAISSVNLVTWSLEVEVQFYCLMPLLASVFTIGNATLRRAILSAAMLAAGVMPSLVHYSPRMELTILFNLQFFLAGFLLADLYLAGFGKQRWYWDLISIVLWPVVFLLGQTSMRIAGPFLALVLYVAAFKGVAFRWFFRLPIIATIGGMCYTIYLWHYQMISFTGLMLRKLGLSSTLSVCLTSVAAILVFSTLYFVLIERPCMDKRWPQKLWQRLRGAKQEERATSLPA